MKKFAVIGLGTFGRKVAITLSKLGAEVIAIDSDNDKIEDVKEHVAQAIRADATNEIALKEIGIIDMDTIIVAVGKKAEVNILVTAILNKLGVNKIIARATSEIQREILKRIGAHKVVFVEEQMAEQIAKSLVTLEVTEYLQLKSGKKIVEIKPRKEFIGKNLGELDFKRKYKINVIALESSFKKINDQGEVVYETIINELLGADDIIKENDKILIIGSDDAIEKFIKGEL